MAGLKELRTRIGSIKSTQKITSAMKMVAAARLRRAQELIGKSDTYSESLITIAGRVLKSIRAEEEARGVRYIYPPLMREKTQNNTYLLIAFSSDRGLCGSYNVFVIKETMRRLNELKKAGKTVKVLCIGKKVGDALKYRAPDNVLRVLTGVGAKGADYSEIEKLAEPLIGMFLTDEFDVCEVIYTRFHSAINREVLVEQLLPFKIESEGDRFNDNVDGAVYEYDVEKLKVLADILPLLVISALYRDEVNAQASEQGARMTSMDNATRNANDMISKLTLKYNRIRQSAITTELVEIIAGAEAL